MKGLHDREEVLNARLAVLDHILNTGQGKLDLEKAWQEGVLDVRCGRGCLPYMEVRGSVACLTWEGLSFLYGGKGMIEVCLCASLCCFVHNKARL